MTEHETQRAYWMERCTHFENRTAQLLRERDDHAAEVARLRAVIHEAHVMTLYSAMGTTSTGNPGQTVQLVCSCHDCTAHRATTT